MVPAPGKNFHDSVKIAGSLDIFSGNYILSLETMLDTPLLLAHQAIRRLTAKALSNLALSPDEARVLEVVGGLEHPTMSVVAARAGVAWGPLVQSVLVSLHFRDRRQVRARYICQMYLPLHTVVAPPARMYPLIADVSAKL